MTLKSPFFWFWHDFQTQFSRDWDIFGKNGYVRWIRLKKFFKMSKSCFFQKKWPNGLNLRVSRSPNSWWRELNFFQNFFKTQWKDRYFVQKKMTNKSLKIIRVYLVPRYAAKFLKNIFILFFNTIGIRKYSRNAHAISFLAYFVPNFLLIIFLKTTKIYLVPPTLKIAKTAEKSSILADLSIHYLFDISGTHYNYNFGLFCSKSWTYHFSQVQLGQSGPAYA